MDNEERLTLLTLLTTVVDDVIDAKIEAMERGDPSARLWLIAKCIWASQRERPTDSPKAGIALGFAMRLTGYAWSDVGG